MTLGTDTTQHRSRWVVPLCWAAVLLDGFDLVVLGTILPALLKDGVWDLTPAGASVVSTAALVGMMIGALTTGTVTDIIGRRKVLIFTVVSFSVFTLLCAFAPSAFLFGVLRFLAGLGLGGCLPTAITLTTEFARPRKASGATTTIMTGYHVGAVLTALVGIMVIAPLGWRPMFVIGAAPGFVLAVLMMRHLPESKAFLSATEARTATPRSRAGRGPVAALFDRRVILTTLAFWVVSFLGLMLVYGLNTWLPQIMREAGYPLGAALGLLLTLNLGATIGLIVAGAVANRIGVRTSIIIWFGAAACFLALLSVRLPIIALYAAVLLAGFFVFSAQVLLYAYVSHNYPVGSRATGLGWTAGIGRIGAICGPLLGGALLTAGLAYPWGFYAFALVGALAATAICLVKTSTAQADPPVTELPPTHPTTTGIPNLENPA